MCGIACLLSNTRWLETPDFPWLDRLCNEFKAAAEARDDWKTTASLVEGLVQRFDSLMSFGLHMEIISNVEVRGRVEDLAGHVRALRDSAALVLQQGNRTDELERLHESLEDYLWQIEWEVLQNAKRARALLPAALSEGGGDRTHEFLAWSIEQVMQSLDKLEIRGRDSAGITIACVLGATADLEDLLDETAMSELTRRRAVEHLDAGHILVHRMEDGRMVCRFIYKIANLVGRLGDNGEALRSAVREDPILWKLASKLEIVNIVAHTRWASNGIINVPNCHPVDGKVVFGNTEGRSDCSVDADTLFVLNGDVDNYYSLIEASVRSRGAEIHPSISTDAKILPVIFHVGTDEHGTTEERFREVMQSCNGSLAVAMQHPHYPENIFLGQKGSGQSLYVGRTNDAWVVASEAYGLAARCRNSYPMTATELGGVSVILSSEWNSTESDGQTLPATFLAGGGSFGLTAEPIEIFSRDIFLKDHSYFIEKEIHEAPDSVRKTLQGKYHKTEAGVEFLTNGLGNGEALLRRLKSRDLPRIRRIVAVGHGTAAIAAMGVAELIRRAIEGSGISVDSAKASELVGFVADRSLDDMLLIAVSQSGTTTDTNRVVDLASEQGAWIHSIVNRRNSPLIRKSKSYIYTSNGRDVEISVASTKAFYSMIAAGKVMGLWLANVLRTLTDKEIYDELTELERLPAKIEEVLAQQETLAAYADELAPCSRYWAVVGNGANRIAAEEIRIKLSELCYISVPCDVTEDKKHIDLSTEPLTIVVANDLPEMVVQDTVKEVVIFRAHNGKPMVFCARGENRFDEAAERTFKLPLIGGGLAFVPATVAGHLWGVEAAKAIDRRAGVFREIRSSLTEVLDNPAMWDRQRMLTTLGKALDLIETGNADSSLPPRIAAAIARYVIWLQARDPGIAAKDARIPEALGIVNRAVEEMTRTIDTIRHQAKTVTVGISRPAREISTLVVNAMRSLGILPEDLKQEDRRLLETLSPFISGVEGSLLYEVVDKTGYASGSTPPRIQAVKGLGVSRPADSRYAQPQPAAGSKRKALRTGLAAWTTGAGGDQSAIVFPVFKGGDPFCAELLLLLLTIAPQASLQQKITLLQELGNKYDEMVEQRGEMSLAIELESILNDVSPRDVIFKSAQEILRESVSKASDTNARSNK